MAAERQPGGGPFEFLKEMLGNTEGPKPSSETSSGGELEAKYNVRIKEMDLRDRKQVQTYINYLLDWRNRRHFADPPETVEALREKAKSSGNHFLVATRIEKDNEGREVESVVGGALIQGHGKNEEDGFISLVVTDPEKQGKGIGKQMMEGVVDWAYGNKAEDLEFRDKIDLAIIMGVEGWQRMEKLTRSLGFEWTGQILRVQATVPVRELIESETVEQAIEEVKRKHQRSKAVPKGVVFISDKIQARDLNVLMNKRTIKDVKRKANEAIALVEAGKIAEFKRKYGFGKMNKTVALIDMGDGKFEIITDERRHVKRFDIFLDVVDEIKDQTDRPKTWREIRNLPPRETEAA